MSCRLLTKAARSLYADGRAAATVELASEARQWKEYPHGDNSEGMEMIKLGQSKGIYEVNQG